MRRGRLILLTLVLGCQGNDGQDSADQADTTGDGDGDGDGDPTGDGDGDPTGDGDGDPTGDGDGEPSELCEQSPDWFHDDVSVGTVHAIALSGDTVHVIVVEGGSAQYLEYSANNTLGPPDTFDAAPNFPPLVRMDAHQGSIAAIAELGDAVLLRSADGTWLVEDAPGLPSGPAAHLAYGPDGTIHVARGGGQLELPGYARRPAQGGWESLPLPGGMIDGFSTPVTVIDGVVHVCTNKYPDVLCTTSASSFTELVDVFTPDANSLDLAGSWMLVGTGIANPLSVTLTALRFDGQQWASVSQMEFSGAFGPVAVHEDALGDLHVAAMTVAEAGQTSWNLRHLKFGQDGSIAHSWVHCSVGSADVVGRPDGTAVVSYSTPGTGAEVFLATPG